MTQNVSSRTDDKQGPDPEVVPRAKRRSFTAAYKLQILEEVAKCDQPGQIGALLRREGLYSSHLTTWRRQRREGQLQGLRPKKHGRKADPQAAEIAALRKENERLRARLEQAELIIDVQKNSRKLWAWRQSRCRWKRANDSRCRAISDLCRCEQSVPGIGLATQQALSCAAEGVKARKTGVRTSQTRTGIEPRRERASVPSAQ